MTHNTSTIERVLARRLWDSRGRPTVEAEVRLASGATGKAIAPAGASRGAREAIDLRDGGRFGGMDVSRAVGHVDGEIAHTLLDRDADDQRAIDDALIDPDGTPNKAPLGSKRNNAVAI